MAHGDEEGEAGRAGMSSVRSLVSCQRLVSSWRTLGVSSLPDLAWSWCSSSLFAFLEKVSLVFLFLSCCNWGEHPVTLDSLARLMLDASADGNRAPTPAHSHSSPHSRTPENPRPSRPCQAEEGPTRCDDTPAINSHSSSAPFLPCSTPFCTTLAPLAEKCFTLSFPLATFFRRQVHSNPPSSHFWTSSVY